ncbi:hypothetical protein ACWGA9_43550 [Streptomyces sp. NPDC054950]
MTQTTRHLRTAFTQMETLFLAIEIFSVEKKVFSTENVVMVALTSAAKRMPSGAGEHIRLGALPLKLSGRRMGSRRHLQPARA